MNKIEDVNIYELYIHFIYIKSKYNFNIKYKN